MERTYDFGQLFDTTVLEADAPESPVFDSERAETTKKQNQELENTSLDRKDSLKKCEIETCDSSAGGSSEKRDLSLLFSPPSVKVTSKSEPPKRGKRVFDQSQDFPTPTTSPCLAVPRFSPCSKKLRISDSPLTPIARRGLTTKDVDRLEFHSPNVIHTVVSHAEDMNYVGMKPLNFSTPMSKPAGYSSKVQKMSEVNLDASPVVSVTSTNCPPKNPDDLFSQLSESDLSIMYEAEDAAIMDQRQPLLPAVQLSQNFQIGDPQQSLPLSSKFDKRTEVKMAETEVKCESRVRKRLTDIYDQDQHSKSAKIEKTNRGFLRKPKKFAYPSSSQVVKSCPTKVLGYDEVNDSFVAAACEVGTAAAAVLTNNVPGDEDVRWDTTRLDIGFGESNY